MGQSDVVLCAQKELRIADRWDHNVGDVGRVDLGWLVVADHVAHLICVVFFSHGDKLTLKG